MTCSWRDIYPYLYSAKAYQNDLNNGVGARDARWCAWTCWSEAIRLGLVIG
jgi:hypothetical protein